MRILFYLGAVIILSSKKTISKSIESNEVNYDFRYSVDSPSSGVYSDHWENRIGEFVKGAYSLLDPDGKIRTVYYEVDGEKGYRAIVKRNYPGDLFLLTGFRVLKKHYTPIIFEKPVGRITRDLLNQPRK